MTNSTPAARSRAASSWNRGTVRIKTEMRYRDLVAVDRVVGLAGTPGHQMGDQLMAVQIPIHPGVGAAPLHTPEYLAVEVACGVEVVDRYRQMETRDGGVERGCHVGPFRKRASCPTSLTYLLLCLGMHRPRTGWRQS
jgi:hypothetical protein